MNVHKTVEIGINNTYSLLSGESTMEDIVEDMVDRNEDPIFLIEPGKEILDTFLLDLMIEYFEDLEEYEKCETLLKLKTN
jgi:hypothetical protein|tara:strand:- start:303 stop:542 length:240 start_codon:yes stop_codon:yes gene_type:complete